MPFDKDTIRLGAHTRRNFTLGTDIVSAGAEQDRLLRRVRPVRLAAAGLHDDRCHGSRNR